MTGKYGVALPYDTEALHEHQPPRCLVGMHALIDQA